MTSSSSPGLSLKMEGISYIAAAELPCVIVNVMRWDRPRRNPSQPRRLLSGGQGEGTATTTAGGGPGSVQEMADLTFEAFDLADKWRNPVMILADGLLGQMMEPVEFGDKEPQVVEKPWATTGARGRKPNIINTLDIVPESLEKRNYALAEKYGRMGEAETRWQEYKTADADLIVTAYGTSARVARSAVDMARKEGLRVGLIRPISLWPFPQAPFALLADGLRQFLVVEMSMGQMVEDVRLAVNGRGSVHFYNRLGGMVPTPRDVLAEIRKVLGRWRPVKRICQRPESLTDVQMHYAPDAPTGSSHRLVAEALDELGIRETP